MADGEKIGVPPWYWVVAVLALVWEAIGCFMYVSQMTMSPEAFAQLPQAQRDMMNASPGWVNAAYAIAVWPGLIGVIGLVLRKAWAKPFLILSVLGIIVQFGWVFAVGSSLAELGPSAAIVPLCILLVGLALVWFAGLAQKRGWIA